jgi:HEAT repeat protein
LPETGVAKRDPIQDRLEALRALRADPGTTEARAALRKALRSRTGLVAAAAVDVVADCGIEPLIAELPAAFVRFLEDPVKRDPQCRAKIAIARALIELGRWEDDVFARGLAHVQREPVWGGSQDTAAPLRGLCALAYAQLGHTDAPVAIADVLADPERAARLAAAQALGDSGRLEAIALCRFKILIGDEEPDVLGAALASLLSLDSRGSISFVAARLADRDDAVADAAALALGESRLAGALPHLLAWCQEAVTASRRQVAHLALALMRHPDAERTLLETIQGESAADAASAIKALSTFAHDAELGARVREAAAANPDPVVAAAAGDAFPEP